MATNTRIILRNDTTNNWTAVKDTVTLLKGEVGIEFDPSASESHRVRMKIGDGVSKWSGLAYFGETTATETAVYQTEVAAGADHAAAIETVVGTATKNKGDIVIVKETITGDKQQYTAYVYTGTAWAAMDGNYSAENVYFKENITLAGDYTQVGNLTKTKTGTATLAVAGKSVKEAFMEMLTKRLQPTKTDPSVTISGTQDSESIEVGATVTKSGTLSGTLNKGSYTYGPTDTGVTATSWRVSVKEGAKDYGSSDLSSTEYSYTFVMNTATRTIEFSAEASYSAGVVAKDNLGTDSNPEIKIAAGTKSKSASAVYTPFRYWFIGGLADTEDLTSTKIRSLTKVLSINKVDYKAADYTGCKRFIIAIPHAQSKTVSEVLLKSASNANITSEFVKQSSTILVEGAAAGADYEAAYDIWIYQPASLDSTEVYTITVA